MFINFVVVFLSLNCVLARRNLKHHALDIHNQLRHRHNVKPVTWDPVLQKHAQRWADQCYYSHSDDYRPYHDHCGENISYGYPSITAAIKTWYGSEIDDYDFRYGESRTGNDILHFTQIVWDKTERIGCAEAYCDNLGGFFHVCNYYPPGNMIGAFTQHVFPASF